METVMNSKKAKALRRSCKACGIDVTVAAYTKTNIHKIVYTDPVTKVKSFTTAYTGILTSTCGRAMYKRLKRQCS